MKYLIFNSTMHAFIPTNITDSKEAKKRVNQLAEMFPSKDWDYSDAEWTLKYAQLDVVMHSQR